ncbi:MAG: universal stress protein [Haloarculaceae archaeon]
MFDTVVIATDGSTSVRRAVEAALDIASTFDASAVHALYVDAAETDPDRRAPETTAEEALTAVADGADREVVTAVREGDPVEEICAYAEEVGADLLATGTRGRHGEHSYLLGSVAEGVARNSEAPVLTARQLGSER